MTVARYEEGASDSLSEAPEDVLAAALVRLDHRLLDVVVHVRLLGRHEDGAAVDALRAERDGGCKSSAVADAARGDVGRLDLARRERELRDDEGRGSARVDDDAQCASEPPLLAARRQ